MNPFEFDPKIAKRYAARPDPPKTRPKAKNGAPHRCSVCGETEPSKFYATHKSRCKTCRNKQITARRRSK